MSESNGASAPEPKFAFNVGRKWGKRWNALMGEATEIQMAGLARGDGPEPDESIEDEKARREAHQAAVVEYTTAITERYHRLAAIAEEQEGMIAQVLVAVPGEWLAPGAPDDLDWSDPASLDWVLEDHYRKLIQALNAARQANLGN